MRILVTRVAGFIASRVAELLLHRGYSELGVDDLCPAYDVRLKQYRLDRLGGRPQFDLRAVDVSELQDISAYWQDKGPFDAVINLAARAGVRQIFDDSWVCVQAYVIGTLNLLELRRQRSVNKFILASTSSLSGTHNQLPFSEHTNTVHYAASKKGGRSPVLALLLSVRHRHCDPLLFHGLWAGRMV